MEIGAGTRYLRFALLGLAILGLLVRYDLHSYRNMTSPEGMDSAQLARNLSEGKGFTTEFVRPFSLYLVQRHNQASVVTGQTATNMDFAEIKYRAHPDLANPPVYPVLLAILLKLTPVSYAVDLHGSFWSESERFARFGPDFVIAVFNQLLLLAVVVLTFFLARKLFDNEVAWVAAVLTIGCELLWRFSASGLSTLLLMVIFMAIVWCVVQVEAAGREILPDQKWLRRMALTAGALVGVGALTRYAFGWAIIPVALFLFLFGGSKRLRLASSALGIFALLLAPWILRNYLISGTPFGTAGYAIVEGTYLFPGFQLERSLNPDFSKALGTSPYIHKLIANTRGILQDELPRLGGSWASMVFLVGLLISFRGVAVQRLRYFLLMCLGTFIIFQALGSTQLSVATPGVNSENLLVLLVPLVFIYSTALFFTLREQLKLRKRRFRYLFTGAFVGLCCLPMIATLLPPKTSPVVYPPYFPPEIQVTAGWMKEDELMMSDVPWAVAWYGHRQCVWLSLDPQESFLAIYDYMKPVDALYLTPETMDSRFLSEWARAGEKGWGSFLIYVMTHGGSKMPPGFQLQSAPPGFLPERLFVTDWERWKVKEIVAPPQ